MESCLYGIYWFTGILRGCVPWAKRYKCNTSTMILVLLTLMIRQNSAVCLHTLELLFGKQEISLPPRTSDLFQVDVCGVIQRSRPVITHTSLSMFYLRWFKSIFSQKGPHVLSVLSYHCIKYNLVPSIENERGVETYLCLQPVVICQYILRFSLFTQHLYFLRAEAA